MGPESAAVLPCEWPDAGHSARCDDRPRKATLVGKGEYPATSCRCIPPARQLLAIVRETAVGGTRAQWRPEGHWRGRCWKAIPRCPTARYRVPEKGGKGRRPVEPWPRRWRLLLVRGDVAGRAEPQPCAFLRFRRPTVRSSVPGPDRRPTRREADPPLLRSPSESKPGGQRGEYGVVPAAFYGASSDEVADPMQSGDRDAGRCRRGDRTQPGLREVDRRRVHGCHWPGLVQRLSSARDRELKSNKYHL